MSETTKIIRVFIGSPGGLDNERRAARDVIDEVNLANSENWGYLFKLVGWEDTIPGLQRPQSLINVDLDRCHYFIGVLWNRWGTKPDLDDSGFSSGFEEEFCRARDRSAAGLMRDIALYFKKVDVPEGLEPGSEIKKVRDFRDKCIAEKQILFKEFSETNDFRDLVRSKIMEIGWWEFKQNVSTEQTNGEVEQSPKENDGADPQVDTRIFDPKALDFISSISTRTGEWEQTSPYEVARFRLIAASLQRSGNDELYLGTHDANLIFRHRKEISFSDQEVSALLVCGIVGFDNQNIPLWRWLVATGAKDEPFERVKFLAIFGKTEVQKNAIKLLHILGEPVPELGTVFSKEKVLKRWLDPEASAQVVEAAAQFLKANGVQEDIATIKEISVVAPPDKKAKLNTVIASISMRSSQMEALRFICENNVDNLSEAFVDAVFSAPSALPTDLLALCTQVKSDNVRIRAFELLMERGEFEEEVAQNLLSDSNHEVRLLAVECLQNGDKPLEPDTVKTVLTIKKGGRGLGLFQSTETDATYYDRYFMNRLLELDLSQLNERVIEAGVFNDQELFALYGKFGKRLADDIRADLQDQFATKFEQSVKKVETNPYVKEDYREDVYRIWNGYTKKLRCSQALAVLCGLKVKSDLGLVRTTLDTLGIDISKELLIYLAKFGDWSDVARIERLTSPSNRKRGLVCFSFDTFVDERAAVIFELGKNRIADLLNADLSSPVRNAVTKLFPKSVFVNLSDSAIITELDRKDDEYRIIFSLRCVESLPKARLETILDQYIDRESQRYYNTIHWLDLGVSFPKKHANEIVFRELIRRSQ